MTISLKTADGNDVATFGTGKSAYAQGNPANEAQFGQSSLFGTGLSRSITTPAATTATKAGSTSDLGYEDPTEGHGIHGGVQEAATPETTGRQLTATTTPDLRGPGTALVNRTAHFLKGLGEGRPSVPGGLGAAGEGAEAAGAAEELAPLALAL